MNEPAVSLGPRQEVRRLLVLVLPGEARRVVVDAGPRGDPVEVRPEVVAAAVLGEPAQTRRRESVRVQPVGHRRPVEREEVRVVRGTPRRDREGAAPRRVLAPCERVHRGAEAVHLFDVRARGTLVGIEARVPAVAVVEALLRLAAEHLLGPLGRAVRVAAGERADLLEHGLERGVPERRDRDVVRAPREPAHVVRPREGRAARRGLELVDAEVGVARPREAPRRGKARDPAAHDRGSDPLGPHGRPLEEVPAAQQVPE